MPNAWLGLLRGKNKTEQDLLSSYCGGSLCATYPNFIENMYEQGIIKAPVISFYQVRGPYARKTRDVPLAH